MQADFFLIVLMVLFGVLAFFLGIFYFAWKVLSGIGRGIVFLFTGRRVKRRWDTAYGERSWIPVVCAMPECRKVEHRVARYCSRCGAPLPQSSER